MSLKEQYWRYSLVAIILLLGILIFFQILPFFSGILGAMTIYILLRNQMLYLTEKKRMKRSIMAILLLCETILCFLIPLSIVVWVFVNKLQAINLDPHSLIAPVEHVAELIREKALRLLSDEIPHGIAVTIEKMKERPNGIIDIDASIVCERDSHKGIIIGKGGSMLKRIGTEARKDIEHMMDTQVNLQLWVKVRKEWRDSDLYMKNYGYDGKDV